jgi:uncharacterized protein YyaL (SSP411 family)
MANAPRGDARNRLSRETSPYLLQHAANPVNWYPWGDEALQLARTSGKPILLSIGYSACHWCHVMAHESFEDAATAQVMNELFVNIKVDREERPDLDRIYQLAQQMLTQRSGGWPLTMFLTHDDQRPFFGGTYFPKVAGYGMPAFKEVLQRVAQYYDENATQLREQNAALVAAFDDLNPPPATDTALDAGPLAACRQQLAQTFDTQCGGFGGAPKFPNAPAVARLLRAWHATAVQPEPDLQALYMATLTLTRMAEGGLNDQLGGGFCRYSVDQYWMIPHFEKMLYDNGALLAVYAEAAIATGDASFARVTSETADWLLREMQSPEGGFYSSFDADSAGHEGSFYIWTPDEISAALTADEYRVFASRFGLTRAANFEGRWHLHAFEPIGAIAAATQTAVDEVERLLASSRRKLLAIRSARVWPARDDKVLTSWNALAIRGLAMAARALARSDLAAAAERALSFVRVTLWRDGRLLATYKDGRAHLNAYLDDYAFLAAALLEMLQLRWSNADCAWLRALLDALLERFADSASGGFFFTASDHEALIHRSKSFSDDATPSGNGVAAQVLLRAGYLLGEPRYLEAAQRTLRAAWRVLEKYPHAHISLLEALEELLAPPEIVVLRGETVAMARWQRELDRLYAPHRLMFPIPADATTLDAAIADKKPRGAVVGYVCRGFTCSAPVESLPELVRQSKLRLADGSHPAS